VAELKEECKARGLSEEGVKGELVERLEAVLGGAAASSPRSVYSTSSSFFRSGQAESIAITLVYVTLSKPNHPKLFHEFPDVRVVAAEEAWSRIRSRATSV
jgi:hypothetical protein